MLKKWTLGMILLSTSLFSQAGLITSIITGADMEGIEVTAYFDNGVEDTQTWVALTPTDGGVLTNDWSLTLNGETFGDYDSVTNTLFGEWTLNNLASSSNIIGLTINAGIANIYFDILAGFNPSTPGSNAGRPFVSNLDADIEFSFLNEFSSPDLFGTLDIDWNIDESLAAGQTLVFLTDTDKVEVPEPSTMFIFALGLIALTSLRKNLQGSN